MVYKKRNAEVTTPDTTPIKIVPFAEGFKEDLYNLYKVYRAEQSNTNYYFDN